MPRIKTKRSLPNGLMTEKQYEKRSKVEKIKRKSRKQNRKK